MKSVFYHKSDSEYDDVTGEQYHFPSQYLSRVEKSLNDWIVYYGPIEGMKSRYYSGIAKVIDILPDEDKDKHYYAKLTDFIDFDNYLDYKDKIRYESKLIQQDGSINGGYAIQAVRTLEELDFAKIVHAGLSSQDPWPDRYDQIENDETQVTNLYLSVEEEAQPALIDAPYERPIIEQLSQRKWRDKKFSHNIRVAYDRTCAFTGLRLINGKGRPEVEAAHIRPVSEGGNDWIRNGIALSGTVHWMFDRGLLSLQDDFTILQSRQLNYDVSHLINKDQKAKVPQETRLQPHPAYLSWHRDNIFKE
jgi:putative restriction endonuclease